MQLLDEDVVIIYIINMCVLVSFIVIIITTTPRRMINIFIITIKLITYGIILFWLLVFSAFKLLKRAYRLLPRDVVAIY